MAAFDANGCTFVASFVVSKSRSNEIHGETRELHMDEGPGGGSKSFYRADDDIINQVDARTESDLISSLEARNDNIPGEGAGAQE